MAFDSCWLEEILAAFNRFYTTSAIGETPEHSEEQAPPVGTSLQLLFNAPEGEVRLRAIVRNLVAGRGMGLGIVSMEPEHRTRLDRWLKRLSAESERRD